MTIEEKRQAILECVNNKKLSGNQIDSRNRGKLISKLKQGKNVRCETIEQIFNNMQKLLADGNEQASNNQVCNQVSPNEEQISHEAFIKRLAGIPENEDNEDDENELEAMRKDVAYIIKENSEIVVLIELLKEAFNRSFDKLQAQINVLKEENQELKNKLDNQVSPSNNQVSPSNNQVSPSNNQVSPSNNQVNDNQVSPSNNQVNDNDVLQVNDIDFLVRKETQATKIKLADGSIKQVEYEKLYAKKRIAGKLHRIYLGNNVNKDKAIEKIQLYCEKHNLKGV
jgi:hypothetical protein